MFHNEPDQPAAPVFATPSFVQHKESANGVLYGPLGLRAGWGIALYTVVASLLIFLCYLGVFKVTGQAKRANAERLQRHAAKEAAETRHQVAADIPLAPLDSALGEFSQAAGVIGAGVLLAVVERRHFQVYGLPNRRLWELLPGAAMGLVAISLLVGTLRAFHLLMFDTRLLHGAAIVRYGAGWLFVFAMVGLFEEFFFRGYIQFTLMRGLLRVGERMAPTHPRTAAFWLAALLWSLLFGATHLGNAGEDPMGIVMVFVAGTLFSYALWKTGSLWWGIGFHATWDWGQSFLYGVPDSGHLSLGRLFQTHTAGPMLLSGGSAGPEGSVLVMPVLLLVAVVLWLHPQAEQPAVEPWANPLHSSRAEDLPLP